MEHFKHIDVFCILLKAITSLPVLEELYVTHNELRVITDLSRCRRVSVQYSTCTTCTYISIKLASESIVVYMFTQMLSPFTPTYIHID